MRLEPQRRIVVYPAANPAAVDFVVSVHCMSRLGIAQTAIILRRASQGRCSARYFRNVSGPSTVMWGDGPKPG